MRWSTRSARRASAHGIDRVEAIELSEDLEATACALHVETAGARLPTAWLADVASLPRVGGISLARRREDRAHVVAGAPWVRDAMTAFVPSAASGAMLQRQAHAFFQANRFLTPGLVQRVLASLDADPVVDLYAGVGLFAVSAAAAGRDAVVAVEGDPTSAADLDVNARPWAGRVRVVHDTVESFVARGQLAGAGTLIVDPPRTGMSRAAVEGMLAARARRSSTSRATWRRSRATPDAWSGAAIGWRRSRRSTCSPTRRTSRRWQSSNRGPDPYLSARNSARNSPRARSSPGATARPRRSATPAARAPRSRRRAPSP